MAKSFACIRTPYGEAAIKGIIDHVRQRLERTEGRHGRGDLKASRTRLLLAAMYRVVEDYEKAKLLLTGYLAGAKAKRTPNPEELFWACFLLAEAYFGMNRIREALAITCEAWSICRTIDPAAKDPILRALWRLAFSVEANGDSEYRHKGFAAVLMALSWYMTRGLYKSRADAPVLNHIRLFLTSYGIGEEEWRWTVNHAHLTRYDFVGLLSTLIHHTNLKTGRVEPMVRQRHHVIEVR